MTRAYVSVILSATLFLTACSAAAPNLGKPAIQPQSPPPTASTPEPSPAPSQAQTPPQSQPATQAPTPGTGSATAPVPNAPRGDGYGQTAPTPVQAQPAIKWYSRGIGLPLTTDDPAGKEKKVVVLTFDDGPSDSGSTAKVLDTLAEHNVKAMFFITGYGARNRDLVERIHREGHVLGPHSMTHANLSRLPVEKMREEIEPLNKLIEEIAGYKPKYLRPPFGAYNQTLIDLSSKEYGMEVLNWTNGSRDWEGVKDGYKDPKLVVDDVMQQLHRGAVVLLHDTLRHTAEALPEIITKIKAEGYEFIVLN